MTIEISDGERLHAWALPSDAARARIVYFHGNGGNLSVWAPIVVDVAAHGFEVFAFDHPGYGASTGRPTERGLYRDADAVLQRVWNAANRRVPTIYWGRSLGTAVAAYAATARPPDGLILEAGFSDARSLIRSSARHRRLARHHAAAAARQCPRRCPHVLRRPPAQRRRDARRPPAQIVLRSRFRVPEP